MGNLNPDQFDYRGLHQPNPDGPPLHNLTEPGNVADGLDIYEHPQYYAADPSNRPVMRETTQAMRSTRGDPNAPVNIYRAAPHGTTHINPGDWVTTSQSYARSHGMHADDPSQDWPVLKAQVPAQHVRYAGDALEEYGYFGPEAVRGL